MQFILSGLCTILVAAQSPPPAYPRAGATALLDNDRIIVWNIAWLQGIISLVA